ncbi:hypothetical protein PQQ96_25445 [Paraburkholderia sediminicola]|uniref:hypothetical protein n=1 Tax=Paraburkholderia sediminicola TaxID=458836 RepID=UPI0038B6B7A8
METETYMYNDRVISLEINERPRGKFSWWYTIDGQHFTECRGLRARSAAIALGEAKHDAERKVDRLLAGSLNA